MCAVIFPPHLHSQPKKVQCRPILSVSIEALLAVSDACSQLLDALDKAAAEHEKKMEKFEKKLKKAAEAAKEDKEKNSKIKEKDPPRLYDSFVLPEAWSDATYVLETLMGKNERCSRALLVMQTQVLKFCLLSLHLRSDERRPL